MMGLTPLLSGCLALTALIHAATYMLQAALPLHLTQLGGTPAEVGLLFSVLGTATIFLRPLIGGWIDRRGARATLVPGVVALGATSLWLQAAATPGQVIALMALLGISHALISMSAGVVAAQAGPAERRGEALGIYYVASSLAISVGAPAGVGLYRAAGAPAVFAGAALMALALGAVALRLRLPRPAPGAVRGRLVPWSRHALPASGVLVLAYLGGSSVIGFLPLYALAHGQEPALWWFFAVYSVWIVLTRLSFRRASDRLGRVRVLAPTIASLALGFLALVPAPTPGRLLAAAVLLGTGTALLYPTLAALVVDRTPEGERGLALGTLAGAFDLSVVVGSAVLGLVAERASFGAAFAVAGTAAALGLPALAVLERARGARSPVARAEV